MLKFRFERQTGAGSEENFELIVPPPRPKSILSEKVASFIPVLSNSFFDFPIFQSIHSSLENEAVVDLSGLHESVVDSDEDLADSLDVSFVMKYSTISEKSTLF